MDQKSLVALLAGGFCLSAAASGLAQEGEGGLTATARLSQNIGWSDDQGMSATTGLGFGLSSQTRTSQFAFVTGTRVILDDDGLDVQLPSVELNYNEQSKSAAFEVEAAWRRADISTAFAPITNEDFTEADFIIDDGTRTNVSASTSLVLGRDAPFGVTLSASTNQTSYSGTADPDLFDVSSYGMSANARFEIDPRITVTSGLNFSRRDTGGEGVDRETFGASLGTTLAVSKSLSVQAQLRYNEITLTDADGTTTEEGLSYSVSANQELPNGTLTASLGNQLGETGRQTTLSFGRTLDLKNGGLSFNAGLTWPEDEDLEASFGVNYNRALTQNTNASVSLSQALAVNNDSEDIRRFRVSGQVNHQLTAVSRVSAGVSLFDVTNLDGGSESSRLAFDVSYAHALTDDWNLTSGVTWRRSDTTDDGLFTDQSVFVGVARDFTWRP